MVLKRAVSPLIATILLIALTISIGAIVIGWGKQYVSTQTKCISADLQVIQTTKGTNNIDITVYNSGTIPLNINDLYIVATAGTTTLTCQPGDPANVGANSCVIDNTGTTTINVGSQGTLNVVFGSGINVGDVSKMEVYMKGCSKTLALIVP